MSRSQLANQRKKEAENYYLKTGRKPGNDFLFSKLNRVQETLAVRRCKNCGYKNGYVYNLHEDSKRDIVCQFCGHTIDNVNFGKKNRDQLKYFWKKYMNGYYKIN